MRRSAYTTAAMLISCTVTVAIGLWVLALGSGPQSTYEASRASQVPSPVGTLEWSLQIGGGYGSGKGVDGIRALEFAYDARSPNQVISWGRTYITNTIEGQLMPTMPQTVQAGSEYTFTAALDDSDIQNRFTFRVSCPISFTQVMSDFLSVSGELDTVDCGTLGSHSPCRFTGRLNNVGGIVCP